MKNREILNGLAALGAICEAHEALQDDIENSAAFDTAVRNVLEIALGANTLLCQSSAIGNSDSPQGMLLGQCSVAVSEQTRKFGLFEKWMPQYCSSDGLSVPVKLDLQDNFQLCIQDYGDRTKSSLIAQYLLVSMLRNVPNLHFRCVDTVSGGNFFSQCYGLVSRLSGRSGGRVTTQSADLSDFLKELEAFAAKAQNRLSGYYTSVYDYNKNEAAKIPEYLVILNLQSGTQFPDVFNRLRILIRNGSITGMNFIVVGDKMIMAEIGDSFDLQMNCVGQKSAMGFAAGVSFALDKQVQISGQEVQQLLEILQTKQTIDTRFHSHPELDTDYLTMRSEQAIRIPFALDAEQNVQYFEIGGDAPAHALIAGSTGSGKSVALHTLIMQIIRNYHPDDVEIWAIDYKAVEFAGYIEQRTPHFGMIAHDTSEEFSLSLLDKLYAEYERRRDLFALEAKVKNINQYRKKMGSQSMPRIVVIIDEFQLLTQAIQSYTGDRDYRTILDNLMKLTRAMGMAFILCSQTITSGLSALSEGARDQIGCRLCLKHGDSNEIRETLLLSGNEMSQMAEQALNLRSGQGIYRRVFKNHEQGSENQGKAYEFLRTNILYFSDEDKARSIEQVNKKLEGNYRPKNIIIARGEGRTPIAEQPRHPINRWIRGEHEPEQECLTWYPAAPATLEDSYEIELDRSAASNILLVGEDDALRESVVLHSVCGFLMNPRVKIVASFLDETYSDRERMIDILRKIPCSRLQMNVGVRETLESIAALKTIRPARGEEILYIWYGLEKLKNELFLLCQDTAEQKEQPPEEQTSKEALMLDLQNFLEQINGTGELSRPTVPDTSTPLSAEECGSILSTAIEMGPENGHFHFVIFNNRKSMKKTGFIHLDCFENRICTRISSDDSYELLGSSLSIQKANQNTVVYLGDSGKPEPLHPYLMPAASWLAAYNARLNAIEV